MRKRNKILAAALGCVATVGTFVAFETIGVFSISGGGRPIERPENGEKSAVDKTKRSASPFASKNLAAMEKTAPQNGYKAFLVGADAYDDVAELRCVKNDVEKLAARLVEIGVDKNNVTVLGSGGKSGDIPTKTHIEARFEKFVDSLKPDDFAIVFLSGHGLQAEGETKEAFFAPVDVDSRDLFGSSVSIDKMLERLDKSRAKSRWMIVDACRNVPQTWQTSDVRTRAVGGAKGLTAPINAPATTTLLQSCQPGEVSYEAGEHGFFTLSLLEALDKNNSKADKDGDGVLYFAELVKYVTARTDALAKEHGAASQRPSFSGKMTDFAVLNTLIEGLPPQRWREANALYEQAAARENEGKLKEALDKIRAAREINSGNENYKSLENRVANTLKMINDAALKAQEAETELKKQLEAERKAREEAEKAKAEAEKAAAKAEAERKARFETLAERLAAEEAARKAQADAEQAAETLRRGVDYEYGLGGVAIDPKKAFELYSEAARLGSASAASRLGQCYEKGIGVEQDEKKAVESIRKAAEANDVWATTILASYYERGFGVEKDEAQGFELRKKAAELGGAEEKRALAWCFAQGVVCEPDMKQALALTREAAELGDATATRLFGVSLALGEMAAPGVERDEAEAFKWLRKAAEAGSADVFAEVVAAYTNGVFVPETGEWTNRDEAKAKEWIQKAESLRNADVFYALSRLPRRERFDWLEQAAELGCIEAARELFDVYDSGLRDSGSGDGVERNPKKAFAALEKFATRPDCPYPDAKFALAVAYAYGYGVEQDAKKAFALFKKQEEEERRVAGPLHEALLLALALCYERGFGVAEDVSKTIELYEKGIALNYPTATANYGWCCDAGRGVAPSAAEALRYYRRASDMGETGASYNLGRCYESGANGLAKDAKKAFELYKKAADAGDPRGMLEVARCYENGVGVERSATEAAKWRNRAGNAPAFFIEPIPGAENLAPPQGLRLGDLGLFVGQNIPAPPSPCVLVDVYPAPCGCYAPIPVAVPAEAVPAVAVPVPAVAVPAGAVPAEAAPCVPVPAGAVPAEAAPCVPVPAGAVPAEAAPCVPASLRRGLHMGTLPAPVAPVAPVAPTRSVPVAPSDSTSATSEPAADASENAGSTSGRTLAPRWNGKEYVAVGESAWPEAPAAGTQKSLTIKGATYNFRYCPAGTFTMGSPASERGRYSDEKEHHITLTQGFWMLETEVTQALWESVTGKNPTTSSRWKGPNKPVGNVRWEDCQEFIAKLNSLGIAPAGLKFRLPTEAEWEYACRAGTSGPYAGSGLDSMGWHSENSGGDNHKVGEKAPNAWGLRDMHGNVWEWCADCKIRTYDNTVAEKVALQAPWKADVFNDDRILSRI